MPPFGAVYPSLPRLPGAVWQAGLWRIRAQCCGKYAASTTANTAVAEAPSVETESTTGAAQSPGWTDTRSAADIAAEKRARTNADISKYLSCARVLLDANLKVDHPMREQLQKLTEQLVH